MLTIQFIPYHEVSKLSSQQRINRLLAEVKENKLVLMEGRLKPEEETKLIQKTMEDVSDVFSGVELCTVYPESGEDNLFAKLRVMFANLLIGDRSGMTLIGPATIVKEIRRDPNKIQLLTNANMSAPKKRSRRK